LPIEKRASIVHVDATVKSLATGRGIFYELNFCHLLFVWFLINWTQGLSQSLSQNMCQEALSSYYSLGDSWKNFLLLDDSELRDVEGESYYDFSTCERNAKISKRYWRRKSELPYPTVEQPLKGVRITIDPGHIGGACAKMEERWFQLNSELPVQEGEMTLYVAKLIKPRLERLGAVVTLTRRSNEPVARRDSPHLKALIENKTQLLDPEDPETQKYKDKLFYRTTEINARAFRVNHLLKPDIVIALHFNAVAWGDPDTPELVEVNHFHTLVNGAYMNGELADKEQRVQLVQRLLYRTHDEEIALAHAFVRGFVEATHLPAYSYGVAPTNAIKVDEEGYIWARNLLANRIYQCPVVYLEPYVMNSREVYARVQAGDYKGEKYIRGRKRVSIYQEYANAIEASLLDYYTVAPYMWPKKPLYGALRFD